MTKTDLKLCVNIWMAVLDVWGRFDHISVYKSQGRNDQTKKKVEKSLGKEMYLNQSLKDYHG